MPLSKEVRRLQAKWDTTGRWPKRLEWFEIKGIRGWDQQRFEMRFPIMAIVGENGSGKSTLLQAAASIYAPEEGRGQKERFASDFFPDTAWDQVRDARISYSVLEGDLRSPGNITKPTDRWRGNPKRRKRHVEYVDLSRIQPVGARQGYVKIANPALHEVDAKEFQATQLGRVSEIMGRPYDSARMATVDAGSSRWVPVLSLNGSTYSGFHQGAGETTVAELLQTDMPSNALVLIDEIESSLHPRAQRRLIRDLAERCREQELQIILTTHSPYVLEELPLQARAYIVGGRAGLQREIIYGVSPELAMSGMDEDTYPEVEIYVEDARAERLTIEILADRAPQLVSRCQTIPFGAASVGQALGQMVVDNRFPRASVVFLDGDRAASPGCSLLPGDDAPERVVFEALREIKWGQVHTRLGRQYAHVADTLSQTMTIGDHHEWVAKAATDLILDSATLWQALAAEWATRCLDADAAEAVIQPITDALAGLGHTMATTSVAAPRSEPAQPEPAAPPATSSTNAPERLFD